jgi:hypothetical protein
MVAARFQPSALGGQPLNKFFAISLFAEPNFFAKRKEVTDIESMRLIVMPLLG